ncbi:MoaD/ThiS family protein [Paenibacillus eucommiae]|uniref:Molybdopterin converting factor small subunit n=1 Tax=Paenibacillus eucommiae TaxID=1355755 RepID=A0ABS4J611_9BACL|nr:MoaD/ThiS family protein [Paenibacillus eucommiae]MBP1995287.1 molybdopterin converting factor small subunit [Paenibacillus eucommiae]
MRISVSIPSLLRDCTSGKVVFELEAQTLREAVELLPVMYPLLRVHLYTESGQLRQHVLLFYNDDNLAWLDNLDLPLREGDRLVVFQAVSGG